MRHRVNMILAAGLMILVVLMTGCGVSSVAGSARPSAKTPAPTPTPTLAWQKRPLPTGMLSWTISPVDGRDVWACVPGQSGGFAIMASQDAAVTWTNVSSLAPTTPEPVGYCGLVPDLSAANVLIAILTWGAGADNSLRSISFISSDGGAHWRRLPNEVAVSDVATAADKTYAILYDTTDPAVDEGSMRLVVSTDGLNTWRQIRPADLATTDGFFGFSLGPAAGEIVAASYNNTLWHSTDGGATWARITTPDQQTSLSAWLPGANTWMFCGWNTSDKANCSVDMGKTWQQRPALIASTPCNPCLKGATPTQSCYPNAIARDGSLIAFCVDKTAYRLMPGASAWSKLGATPATPLAQMVGGQLWCFDEAQQTLFVATLPA